MSRPKTYRVTMSFDYVDDRRELTTPTPASVANRAYAEGLVAAAEQITIDSVEEVPARLTAEEALAEIRELAKGLSRPTAHDQGLSYVGDEQLRNLHDILARVEGAS